jgi:VWFA-related protein
MFIHRSGIPLAKPRTTIPRKLIATVVFAILTMPALCIFSLSQANSATPASSDADVVNVNEVTVDLTARQKNRKPVADLKPEDIAITDNGSAVKISDLRLVTGGSEDHLVTLLFDQLDPSAATNAHNVAKKILKLIPAKGFSFSVLNISGRLRLVQEFTPDRAAIEKAVISATSVEPQEKEAGVESAEKQIIAIAQTGADPSGKIVTAQDHKAAEVMLATLRESQRIVQEQRIRPSLAGLLALARMQRRIGGRKVVIYFSEGLQADPNNRDMVKSIAEAANRSGVSVYVIDKNALDESVAEGMMATVAMGGVAANNAQNPAPTGPNAPHGAYGPGMISQINDQINRIENEGFNASKDPLFTLAVNTGGAFNLSEDSLKKPIQELVEDSTVYYEASYIPPAPEYNGEFRSIAVKPLRRGLTVRSRAGYFAVPPDSGTAVRPFEAPLMKVLAEAQLPAELKFRSRVLRLGDLPNGNENALVVEVPVSELETRDDVNGNLYSLRVSIVAQIKSKTGTVVEHFSEDVPRHGAIDAKASVQSDSITMQRNFTAGPGEYVMEVAIIDRVSGRTAAQRLDFEVPKDPSGPSLSDVAIVQRMIPSSADVDSEDPMRYGSSTVVPDVSGSVAHGRKEISFFFLVHPDSSAADQPTLEMDVLKSGEQIAQVPLSLRKASGPSVIPYLASIQSASLPSGDYQVIERLTQSGKTTEREVAFRVEGPELADATKPEAGPDNDADSVTASDLSSKDADGGKGPRLVITSLPAGTVPAPSAEELQNLVASARRRALDYSKSLPNFICVEATNRSVDASGNGRWKHRDSIAELLRYHDGQESRTTLEVNGQRSSLTRAEMNSSWPLSVGEFGGLLNLVFQPTSKTEFEWKEAATREDRSGTVQVLSYRVKRDDATITLGQGNDQVGAGFHGLVYIDGATGGVQRITLEADDLPRSFSMTAASMTVDYDYASIADRDYLLPVRSTVSLQRHHKSIELNELAFRGYRRFASKTKIKMVQ